MGGRRPAGGVGGSSLAGWEGIAAGAGRIGLVGRRIGPFRRVLGGELAGCRRRGGQAYEGSSHPGAAEEAGNRGRTFLMVVVLV